MDLKPYQYDGESRKISSLFNGLSNQKKLDDHRLLHEVINADENTLPSLMIQGNHQTASAALAQKIEKINEEKAHKWIYQLIFLLKQRDQLLIATLESINLNLIKMTELDQKILECMNDFGLKIEELETDHENAAAILNDPAANLSHSSALKPLLTSYETRTGLGCPETNPGIRQAVNEQIHFEKTFVIPDLKQKTDSLGELHETSIVEREKLETLAKEIEDERITTKQLDEEQQLEAFDNLQEKADQALQKSETIIENMKKEYSDTYFNDITAQNTLPEIEDMKNFTLDVPVFHAPIKGIPLKP